MNSNVTPEHGLREMDSQNRFRQMQIGKIFEGAGDNREGRVRTGTGAPRSSRMVHDAGGSRLQADIESQEHRESEQQEDDCGDRVHHALREFLRGNIAEQHRRHVGEQHADRGAGNDGHERVVVGRQCDRRDLRLVAHFDEKERDQRGAEDTNRVDFAEASSSLSGTSIHSAMAMNDRPSAQRMTSARARA